MLVGETFGGKTSCYKTLQKTINKLNLKNDNVKKIKVEIINPKSLTLNELYGVSKDVTWDEGIIEIVMEKAIKTEENLKHWILFDGPVDAVWIESMNTVLDDNKKLCLSSGKVLLLT
jgi:dynein heavy chain